MSTMPKAPIQERRISTANGQLRDSLGLPLSLHPSPVESRRNGHGGCARCPGLVVTQFDDRLCVNCGWRDHSYVPHRRTNGRSDAMVARYAGAFPLLRDTVVVCRRSDKPRVTNNTVLLTPRCPWCGEGMAIVNHGGASDGQWYFGKTEKAKRFACPDRHQIWVWSVRAGLRWE